MNKEAINNRFIAAIDAIIQKKPNLTKSQLAESFGVKPSKFSEILNDRMKAGADMLAMMSYKYGVSLEWLLKGEGSIFGSREEREQSIAAHPVNASADGGIPLIPFEAMAGFFHGEESAEGSHCQQVILPGVSADFVIPISGDSMAPHFMSGDMVACTFVTLADLFFQWDSAYIIDTNQGVLLKRVRPGSTPDTITLVSDNPRYLPFEIPRESIYHLALVKALVHIE